MSLSACFFVPDVVLLVDGFLLLLCIVKLCLCGRLSVSALTQAPLALSVQTYDYVRVDAGHAHADAKK